MLLVGVPGWREVGLGMGIRPPPRPSPYQGEGVFARSWFGEVRLVLAGISGLRLSPEWRVGGVGVTVLAQGAGRLRSRGARPYAPTWWTAWVIEVGLSSVVLDSRFRGNDGLGARNDGGGVVVDLLTLA